MVVDIEVPSALLPNDNVLRRQVTPDLYPGIYGLPGGGITPEYGDPGLIFGADDTGFIPNFSDRPPLHHNYAYEVMSRYLQTNMFAVIIQDGVALNFTQFEFQNIIIAGKPAYTYLYMDINPRLEDTVEVSDSFGLGINVANENIVVEPDQAIYGSPALLFGDWYQYAGGSPNNLNISIENNTHSPAPNQDQGVVNPAWTPVTFGGADPTLAPASLPTNPRELWDAPAYVIINP